MTEFIEFWERWVASTREPIDYAQNAKVRRETDSTTIRRDDLFGTHCDVVTRPGRKLITFTFERDGEEFICEDMPENALTKPCGDASRTGNQRRHLDCDHRLGARAEGGVLLCYGPTRFVWRCGCACHRDPARAGLLV